MECQATSSSARRRGRTRRDEHLIGFFVNLLRAAGPISLVIPRSDVVRRVKDTALGAYAHQDLPFEKLVDALRLERDLSPATDLQRRSRSRTYRSTR